MLRVVAIATGQTLESIFSSVNALVEQGEVEVDIAQAKVNTLRQELVEAQSLLNDAKSSLKEATDVQKDIVEG